MCSFKRRKWIGLALATFQRFFFQFFTGSIALEVHRGLYQAKMMLMRWMLLAMDIAELKRNHIWLRWYLRKREVSSTVLARLPHHFNNTIQSNWRCPVSPKIGFQIENNYLVQQTRQLRQMSFSLSHTMLRTNRVAAFKSQFHLLFVFCLYYFFACACSHAACLSLCSLLLHSRDARAYCAAADPYGLLCIGCTGRIGCAKSILYFILHSFFEVSKRNRLRDQLCMAESA